MVTQTDNKSDSATEHNSCSEHTHSSEHTTASYIETAKSLGFTLEDSTLTDEEKQDFLCFLGQNRDVFAKDLSELGTCNLYQYRI